MNKGDLISFKPEYSDHDDWSNPAIVLYQFHPESHPEMWVVWCEGDMCVIDEENYDVAHLTSSLQESA